MCKWRPHGGLESKSKFQSFLINEWVDSGLIKGSCNAGQSAASYAYEWRLAISTAVMDLQQKILYQDLLAVFEHQSVIFSTQPINAILILN